MAKDKKVNAVILEVFLFLLFFIAGFLASTITGFSFYSENGVKNVLQEQKPIAQEVVEKPMPGDWVRKDKIKVYDDKVVLDIKKAEWSEFTNTHSMEPLLGMNANGIELKPGSEAEVNIGDVVAYNSSIGTVIHRVIKKDVDENGTYFILKGDNNEQEDSGRVRFEDIERVLVGVIY